MKICGGGGGGGWCFFFQAEDGIRDYKVTGVQTCALPISIWRIQQYNSDMRATRLNRLGIEDGDKEMAEMKDRIEKIENQVQQMRIGFSKA